MGSGKATSHPFSPAVSAPGVQNAPKGQEKQDTHTSENMVYFFFLRRYLSFFAALHLPAQKWLEEQTPPDFNSSADASGRPSENRSESSSVRGEW